MNRLLIQLYDMEEGPLRFPGPWPVWLSWGPLHPAWALTLQASAFLMLLGLGLCGEALDIVLRL